MLWIAARLAFATAPWIMIVLALRRGEIRATTMRSGIARRSIDPHAFWLLVAIYVLFAILWTAGLVGPLMRSAIRP